MLEPVTDPTDPSDSAELDVEPIPAPDEPAASDLSLANAPSGHGEPTGAPSGAAEAGDDTVWYASVDGAPIGPFSADEVRSRLASGDLLAKHYVWRLGFGEEWYRLREVPDFRDSVRDQSAASTTGMPDRLLCTNCFGRVLPRWAECPTCGHELKATPPSADDVVQRDVVHRILAMVGAVFLLLALALPWLEVPTRTVEPGVLATTNAAGSEAAQADAVAGIATLAGIDGYLGGTFALLAVVLAFFAGQALLGGTYRPVLITAISVWTFGLCMAYLADVHGLAPGIRGLLDPALMTGTGTAADTSSGLGLIAPGFALYRIGVLLILFAFVVPAIRSALRRRIPSAIAVAVVALIAVGHVQLINGTLYQPLIEARLTVQGFQIEELERVDTPGNAGTDGASLQAVGAGTDSAAGDGSRTGQPFGRASDLGTGSGVHVYRIVARNVSDGRLYVATTRIPLGSLLPLRGLTLQRVPISDEALYEYPIDTNVDDTPTAPAEGGES